MHSVCRLDELVVAIDDKTGLVKDPAMPYLGLEHIGQRGAGLNGSAASSASVSINSAFKAGDVLFGKLRPNLRKCALAPFDGYCSTDVLVLRPLSDVDPRFAVRVFQTEKVASEAERTAAGTKMPRTSWNELRGLEVFCTDSSGQATIADVLDTLDTTIRQTEAIIEKLRQVKQGLLHDLLTRGIDANGELRPPQGEAPHLYRSSPVGWIPKEWSAGPLSEWLQGRPKNGYSPQPAGRWTGIQMLGLGCLTATGFQPRQLKDAPASDPLVRAAFLAPGDLLMSRANTRDLVGLVGRYRDVGTACCYPDLMMRLTPAPRTSAAFLELVLSSPGSRRQIQALASGTSGSMVKISGSIVMALNVSVPEPSEQARILECLDASDQRLRLERNSVEQLQALKSGLMDDLFTGRVRVTPLLS
jgi:type I restriction enzyme S subunit